MRRQQTLNELEQIAKTNKTDFMNEFLQNMDEMIKKELTNTTFELEEMNMLQEDNQVEVNAVYSKYIRSNLTRLKEKLKRSFRVRVLTVRKSLR
jgi:ABC-type Fe3+/spermidine/putrescine transport system ATPase subunit